MASLLAVLKHILLLLLLVAISVSSQKKINKNLFPTPRLVKYGDKIYFIQTYFKANWHRAEQFCRYQGMQLASIGNSNEHKALQAELQRIDLKGVHRGFASPRYWISGNDLAEKRAFVWSANGESLLHDKNWEVQSLQEIQAAGPCNCVALSGRHSTSYHWYKLPCQEKKFFICQVENRVQNRIIFE